MMKATFSEVPFTSKLDLAKCYTWSTDLHGAACETLRGADQKYLKGFMQ